MSAYLQWLWKRKGCGRLLVDLNETFNGILGTKDKANNAKQDDKSAPGELIDWLVAETSELEIEHHREDEDQTTV